MILPVTNYERPCNEQVNAFVYCEIDPATFKGEIHVHVIEQTPVTFIKRVVTWSDRNARRNFYFKEWCDSEKTFYSSFFSCVTINHLHPIDPMYFRNNPTELDTFLEETRRLRSISDDTGGEGSKWYVLFDSIVRNLCAMSLTKKVDTRNENRLNVGRNSDFSTKVEIFAATEKEIAMYANDEHKKELPLMFWFGKDTSKDTDREPYFSSPIAEPIEAPASEKQSEPSDNVSMNPCPDCGWIHTKDFTKWTNPKTGKACRPVRPNTNKQRLLMMVHQGMITDGGDTAMQPIFEKITEGKGQNAARILGHELYKQLFVLESERGRIIKPGEIKKKGHPKK